MTIEKTTNKYSCRDYIGELDLFQVDNDEDEGEGEGEGVDDIESESDSF